MCQAEVAVETDDRRVGWARLLSGGERSTSLLYFVRVPHLLFNTVTKISTSSRVQVDVDLCARLIEWVCEDAGLPEGAVLVFLPGWDEINRLRQVRHPHVSALVVLNIRLNV